MRLGPHGPAAREGGLVDADTILAALSPYTREELLARATAVRLRAGEQLFAAGDHGDSLYVVVSGRVEAVIGEGVIRVAGRGELIGELAVLVDAPRSATVRARRDSELLELPRAVVDPLLRSDAAFAAAVARLLAGRLHSGATVLERRPLPATIAVLRAGDGPELATELSQTLGRGRRVALLREPQSEGEPDLGPLLDRAEHEHDQVVLDATGSAAWVEFCLRQADRVVVSAAGSPAPMTPAVTGCDVLLAEGADASGWSAALDARVAVRSLDEVARRLAGHAAGLVLSGGGARALAHVGVLDQLVAGGVRIDRIGGCSMGAFVGALFASGRTPEEVAAVCRAELVDRSPLGDYAVPLVALMRGGRGRAMLRRCFGDLCIEDLEREFFCVSCDLVSSSLMIHRRGLLAEALTATMCLPGVFPPVARGGRALVDGGVLDNLPVAAMAASGEGPVIASDVTARFSPPRSGRLRRRLARARAVVTGTDTPVLTFPETLMRTMVLGSLDTAAAARRHADVVIAPAVGGVGMLDFARLDEMRAEGRRAVLEAMPTGER